MKSYILHFLVLNLFLLLGCNAQNNERFNYDYLNENQPIKIPLLFGDGKISIEGKNTHSLVFSPDGKQLFFSRYPDGKSYEMNFINGKWSEPTEAIFKGKEISITASNDKIFYYKDSDGDIYYNIKSEQGWGNEINIGAPINTAEVEYFPSVTKDGTLFFSRNASWKNSRIMYSKFKDGKYQEPVDLGATVNNGGASHAIVASDKSYMIFNSPREGSFTNLDLWITFSKKDLTWTSPINLGKKINSDARAILCPTLSPDGKFLFFTKLKENGSGYIYWVSTKFISELRK